MKQPCKHCGTTSAGKFSGGVILCKKCGRAKRHGENLGGVSMAECISGHRHGGFGAGEYSDEYIEHEINQLGKQFVKPIQSVASGEVFSGV